MFGVLCLVILISLCFPCVFNENILELSPYGGVQLQEEKKYSAVVVSCLATVRSIQGSLGSGQEALVAAVQAAATHSDPEVKAAAAAIVLPQP